jgi:ribosome assembly protein 1
MLPPPESTRLVTIIAHVDHGKTTLADNLIESNGIISERLAGTLRYLDSDPEEQRRGITMRASAIGLKHSYIPPKISQNKHQSDGRNDVNSSSNAASSRDMVIHLVDSPGHVDFAAEVTSSLLLCDSAILVVDAVEGLCPRTHSLVREAYLHQLVPILVINKVDRLCMEMGLDPTETYVRIRELIESMNAICASMLTSAATDDDNGFENSIARDAEIEVWNFDPIKGNVVFASALHGWGFTIPTLARSLFKSKTIPMKPPLMRQYLFGDYKYNSETGKVLKWKQSGGRSDEPMFAKYALEPIWEIYAGVSQAAASVGLKSELFVDTEMAQNKKKEHAKIEATTLGIERVIIALHEGSTSPSFISPQPGSDSPLPKTAQDLQRILSRLGAGSESSIISAVLRRYRPLSNAVLDAVCEIGPSPTDAAIRYRRRALALQTPHLDASAAVVEKLNIIQEAVRQCRPSENDVPTVAHVCKFTSTSRASVADPDLPHALLSSSESIILGIARVLSGSLRTDDIEYYMFGPRYNGNDTNITKQKIRCYLLMGSSFVRVNSVPAGHICAIYNLEHLQLKTVTLCDRKECMPLHGFDVGLQPLVKVNVEPVSASGASF